MSIVAMFLIVAIPFGLLMWLVIAHDRASRLDETINGGLSSSFSRCERALLVRKQVRALNSRKSKAEVWPIVVIELASACTKGEDCGFALHDALLEADRPEEAEAFRLPDHPLRLKTLRQILGKSGESDGLSNMSHFH